MVFSRIMTPPMSILSILIKWCLLLFLGRQDPTLRRTTITRTGDDVQENAETGQPRRRLGVCEGEAHALMLEEMLKGANVVISGDAGKPLFVSARG